MPVHTDIGIILVEASPGGGKAIQDCLAAYRQVAFGVTVVQSAAQAIQAAGNRSAELAIVDVCSDPAAGERLLDELNGPAFPPPLVAVAERDRPELLRKGAVCCISRDRIETTELPTQLVKLWLRLRSEIEDEEIRRGTREARAIIEEQRKIVERFHKAKTTFSNLVPEDGKTFDALSDAERLQLKLDLVDGYIDVTKVYFARADEESEELISQFCDKLAALRYPPRELTSIHLAALELMLTEPGQDHRRGLISQNRLVFIDILLNLLGQYFAMLEEKERTEH